MQPLSATTALDTADFRRRVHARYAQVRSAPSAGRGHERWAAEHDRLLREHPATPLLPEHRAAGARVPVAPYDPAWRFEVPLLDAPAERIEVRTGTDGVVGYERIILLSHYAIPWEGKPAPAKTAFAQ